MQALWKLSQKATAAATNRKQAGSEVKPALLHVLSWTQKTSPLPQEESFLEMHTLLNTVKNLGRMTMLKVIIVFLE